MLFPHPPRNPSEPLRWGHMICIAHDAIALTQTIRDYLPMVGDDGQKSNPMMMDRHYDHARDAYRRIELLRNPRQLVYQERDPGFSGYFEGPQGCLEQVSELLYALNPICEHYGWQGVSDGSRMPHSRVREGEAIPPIEERLLAALEKPARRLLESEIEAREARAFIEAEAAGQSAGEPGRDASEQLPSIEQHMERVAQAVGDDNAVKILVIANQKTRPGEDRMKDILELDYRFAGKNSVQWSSLLDVTPDAIRGYGTWKRLQERKKAED